MSIQFVGGIAQGELRSSGLETRLDAPRQRRTKTVASRNGAQFVPSKSNSRRQPTVQNCVRSLSLH